MGFKRLDTFINPLLRTITLEFGPFDSDLFDFWFCAVHVDQLFESWLRRLMEVPSFRTPAGAKVFATLRSVLATARKQGWDILKTLAAKPEQIIHQLHA